MLPMDVLCFSAIPGKTYNHDPQADLMRRTGHRGVLVIGVGSCCIQIISYCEAMMTL